MKEANAAKHGFNVAAIAAAAQVHGAIFVDTPTLGWNVSRVWWAPERLIAKRPEFWDEERMCPDEDHRNYERLIDTTQGVGKIICPFIFTQRIQSFLRQYFGFDECPFVFTGGVEFDRALKKRKAEN